MKGVDPVLRLLAAAAVFFSLLLIFVEWRFNSDAQVFQVFAGILTGVVGAFLGRVDPKKFAGAETADTVTVERSHQEPVK